jgi:ankyrin repeat protein
LIKSGNYGYYRVAKALLEGGAQVDVRSKNGNTSLMKACEKGYIDLVRLLLQYRANIELHDNTGCCPLIRASAYGHLDIVRLLLDNGADINVLSGSGNSALLKATEKGFDKIAKLLIDKGANLDITNKSGLNAMKMARRGGHGTIVNYIREREKQNLLVANALLRAVQAGDQRHSVALIKLGAPCEERYADGCFPLNKSCNFGYSLIVDALIAQKVDLNMQSKNGNTGLMKGNLIFVTCPNIL